MANTKKDNEEKTKKNNSQKNSKSGNNSNVNKNSSTKKVDNKSKTTVHSKSENVKKVDDTKEVERVEVVEENDSIEENIDSKKLLLIVVGLIIFFSVIFYLSTLSGKGEYQEPIVSDGENYDTTDVASESAAISEDEMSDLTEISVDDYINLKKSDEKYSVIYVGRPTCSHCTVQLPIMKHMVYKYGIEVNYLNTDNFDSEGKDATKLQKSDDYFSEGWGTPLVLIVKDDEIVDYSEGEPSIERLTELFKKYELISE